MKYLAMPMIILAGLVLTRPAYATSPWRHPLYLSGGGVWEKRAAIRFADSGESDSNRMILAIPVVPDRTRFT